MRQDQRRHCANQPLLPNDNDNDFNNDHDDNHYNDNHDHQKVRQDRRRHRANQPLLPDQQEPRHHPQIPSEYSSDANVVVIIIFTRFFITAYWRSPSPTP